MESNGGSVSWASTRMAKHQWPGTTEFGFVRADFGRILYESVASRDGIDRVQSGIPRGTAMSHAKSADLLRQVRTLFSAGTVAGLSDAELLERFTAQSAAAEDATLAAEAAFAALVARHGPMVLGVCRRAPGDAGDVEDAFQATFLVLVRRAGSVRVGDSLGRWLYGVARRVAAKARSALAACSSAAARCSRSSRSPRSPRPSGSGCWRPLDEEVSRLPEKYRAPVILCHLEGLTPRRGGGRGSTGRSARSAAGSRGPVICLRDRLVRRGLGPTAGSMVALLSTDQARAAVPESLAAVTARSATRLAIGGVSQAGTASASVLSLISAVLRAAVVVKLKVAAAVLLFVAVAGAAIGVGIGAGAGTPNRVRDQDVARAPVVTTNTAAQPSANRRTADEIVKEIEATLKAASQAQGGHWGELRLMPAASDIGGIPDAGKSLIVVAVVDHVLHFRIFDGAGKVVANIDEKKLAGQPWRIQGLKKQLESLWPPHDLTRVNGPGHRRGHINGRLQWF